MTPATNTPVIGLVRVSTEEQEASGAGMDAQEAAIRARCEARGWDLVEIVREAASGKTLAKRPELQSILARLENKTDKHRPQALVVAKLDRLARSMLDYASMLERAERRGWSLVCIEPDNDFSTSSGRMMATMLMGFAQYEREIIGERTRAGLAAKRAQGVILGRPRTMPADALARLRALRSDGLSYRKVAAALNDEGIKGAQGGSWHDGSVIKALRRYGATDS